jgi:hypothetical protein
MIQKKDFDLDEDLDNNLDEELGADFIEDVIIDEEFGDGDIVETVECDEDDDVDTEEDVMFKFNTNNHKLEGKHSLTRDTIFKGKLDDNSEQSEYYIGTQEENYSYDGLPIEVGSNYEFESKYHEEYVGRLNLSRDVFDLLTEKTELDFSSNRRKPNKQAFNDYYKMLLDNIGKEYTKSEIFVELSYYFTDNIFNMFKLLDKEYATQIIVELKQSGYLNNLNNINFI